jgi:hypothetical protein
MTPTTGITMSSTSELTMSPNAPPMITPTARSMTLPRAMKVLNSCNMPLLLLCPDRERPNLGHPVAMVNENLSIRKW